MTMTLHNDDGFGILPMSRSDVELIVDALRMYETHSMGYPAARANAERLADGVTGLLTEVT